LKQDLLNIICTSILKIELKQDSKEPKFKSRPTFSQTCSVFFAS